MTKDFHCGFDDCAKTFSSFKSLENHQYDYHEEDYITSYQTPEGLDVEVKLVRENNILRCPCCSKEFVTYSAIRKHLQANQGTCSQKTFVNEDDSSATSDLIHCPLPLPSYEVSPTAANDSQDSRHTYDESFIFACQSMEEPESGKAKNQWILETLKMEPIALIEESDHRHKAEYNALTHANNAKKLVGKRFVCQPILPPQKRSRSMSSESTNTTTSFANLVHSSPLRSILAKRDYFELDDNVCRLLNSDWDQTPSAKYACAQALAGCIMLNERTGRAILVNTLEIYGRQKTVDIHREVPTENGSIPLPSTLYKHVMPCVVRSSDGDKLTIGTHTMNALITSTLRLDENEEPNVGPSACSTGFNNAAIRVFADRDSWSKAMSLLSDKDTKQLEPFNLLHQLRQIRSHFHDPSTYLLVRCSSFLAEPFCCQPLTVFTLASCDQGPTKSDDQQTASKAGSKLFHDIAAKVLFESIPLLPLSLVKDIAQGCPPSKVKDRLADVIETSFASTTENITVIGNRDLNSHLTNLASLLSSDISKANKSYVARNIQTRVNTILNSNMS